MKNTEHDDILNSLQDMKRAAAPAFFYTRLRARMEQELETASFGRIGRLLTRPALSLSLAAIVLLLNITTIMEMVQQPKSPTTESSSPPMVIADYSFDTYTVYDETPAEP